MTNNRKNPAAGRRYAERQAQKEEAARQARRQRNTRYGIFTIILVICIVGVLVIVKVAGGGGGSSSADQLSPPAGTPIAPATLAKLSSVPISTLNSAPTDGILTQVTPARGQALTSDGKPELLYVGAEFCPHCAAERWPLYIALSKFGTFSPEPGKIHSATQDGNVPTFTFYGTTYTSPYFSFVPVEVYTNHPASGGGYTVLQNPTASQLKTWTDANGGTFPFIDFGGKQQLLSAQYSYASLQGLPFAAVAAQVGNNSTTIGADIGASASQLIKAICSSLSGGKPATVCSP